MFFYTIFSYADYKRTRLIVVVTGGMRYVWDYRATVYIDGNIFMMRYDVFLCIIRTFNISLFHFFHRGNKEDCFSHQLTPSLFSTVVTLIVAILLGMGMAGPMWFTVCGLPQINPSGASRNCFFIQCRDILSIFFKFTLMFI